MADSVISDKPGATTGAPILIVDADPALVAAVGHSIAELRFNGHPIAVESAHTVPEARDRLAVAPEPALMLIDGNMAEAGDLVRWLRVERGLRATRIVLLGVGTPDLPAISDDIDGRIGKAGLAVADLSAVVLPNLHAFEALRALDAGRRSLCRIVDAIDVPPLADAGPAVAAILLAQIGDRLGVGTNGILCAVRDRPDCARIGCDCIFAFAGSGAFAGLVGHPLGPVVGPAVAEAISLTLDERQDRTGPAGTTLYVCRKDGSDAVVHLDAAVAPDHDDCRLLVRLATRLPLVPPGHGDAGSADGVRGDGLRDCVQELQARLTERTRELEQARRERELLALIDPLTGALNRSRFLHASEQEIERARRHGRPLAVTVIDLDHFKTLNAAYGHAVGDEVLRQMVRIIGDTVRSNDLVGRIGGEEFALLLVETDLDDAVQVAERLCHAIALHEFTRGCLTVRTTASLGVTQWYPAEATLDTPLARADKALHEAKRSGRNRVEAV
jgi:diguanylate cyclase (GGDEF)-like protein